MLASLLPGLRDVRTPLTVGYLWMLVAWLAIGDSIATAFGSRDGAIGRAYELYNFFGRGAALAAISFAAYLIGALLSTSFQRALRIRFPWPRSVRSIDQEYRDRVARVSRQLRSDTWKSLLKSDRSKPLPAEERETRDGLIAAAALPRASDLRTRLLVANQELYGEYDRLAAEGDFRVNVALPLAALAVVLAVEHAIWLIVLLPLIALVFQGLSRQALAFSVLQQAVLTNVIELPVEALLREYAKE